VARSPTSGSRRFMRLALPTTVVRRKSVFIQHCSMLAWHSGASNSCQAIMLNKLDGTLTGRIHSGGMGAGIPLPSRLGGLGEHRISPKAESVMSPVENQRFWCTLYL